MSKKEELQKLLDLVNEWPEHKHLYECSMQDLLNLICNRFVPFEYIKLGQMPDVIIKIGENGNMITEGPSKLQHYIEIGDHRIFGSQTVAELVNLLKALIENE